MPVHAALDCFIYTVCSPRVLVIFYSESLDIFWLYNTALQQLVYVPREQGGLWVELRVLVFGPKMNHA